MAYIISANHILNNIVTSGSSYTYTGKVSKNIPDEKETDIAGLAKKLSDNCMKLFKANYSSGASFSVTERLNNFIDSYNELAKEIDNSTSTTAKKDFKEIQNLLEKTSSELKKIGVHYKDGEFAIDAEKLAKTTSSRRVYDAFKGKTNLLSGIMKYSNHINSTLKNKSVVKEYPSYKTVELEIGAVAPAIADASMISSLDALAKYSYTESNRASIKDLISSYATNYNSLIDSDDNDLINELKSLTLTYKDQLEDSGLRIENDHLIIDETAIDNAVIDNLKDLFSNEADYSSNVTTISKNLFADYVKASDNNITLTY